MASSTQTCTHSQPMRRRSRRRRRLICRVALAGDAVPRSLALDPPQLLDVDVDQLAGPGALVAAGRAPAARGGRACRGRSASAPRETVEVAISRISAISGPVSRSRRSATIASTRSGVVTLWTRLGGRAAIQQARLALLPGSARTHLPAVLALTPAASAASVSAILSSSTRLTMISPALRAEGRVSVELHPVPPWCWVLRHRQPPRRPGAMASQLQRLRSPARTWRPRSSSPGTRRGRRPSSGGRR